jgi:hypothetical protein
MLGDGSRFENMDGLGKVDGYTAKEEKDGRDRLLPTQQSSFNDINMWYKGSVKSAVSPPYLIYLSKLGS